MKPSTPSLPEIIRQRTSVRTFFRQSLQVLHRGKLQEYIDSLTPVLGGQWRIELLEVDEEEVIPLGTYGVVRGAPDYLTLIYREGAFDEESAGYAFEQVVLFATSLQLGTCWMGGTFRQADFAQATRLAPDEHLRIVSPVGYPDSPSWIDRTFRWMANHKKRKHFEELFFDNGWQTPLTVTAAGQWAEPLEMVRLAPSARNKQPWRVLRQGSTFHFYRDPKSSAFTRFDLGIALCHFCETARALDLSGELCTVSDPLAPPSPYLYVASWQSL